MLSNQHKEEVAGRAKGLCEYCKSPSSISSQPFVAEHIIPRSKNGSSELSNLALSCQGCNNHKYTRVEGYDAVSGDTVPLFNPRIHAWHEHFVWSATTYEILGITASGRVTVDALRLNRQELQNLRTLLYSAGMHPPA